MISLIIFVFMMIWGIKFVTEKFKNPLVIWVGCCWCFIAAVTIASLF